MKSARFRAEGDVRLVRIAGNGQRALPTFQTVSHGPVRRTVSPSSSALFTFGATKCKVWWHCQMLPGTVQPVPADNHRRFPLYYVLTVDDS
jgi:hypothetical protein